jgi:hypothetical protein
MLVFPAGEAPGFVGRTNPRPRRNVRDSDPLSFSGFAIYRNPARKWSNMTPEEVSNIAAELKRLGAELNLSDSQKDQLKSFLTEKYEQLQEYRKQNPNLSKEDIAKYIAKNREAGRQKLEKFLTPEQLKTWDAEVAKAKDFLSQRAAKA